MDTTKLPLEYLLSSSQSGLEGVELSRLNQISNLRKELRDLVDEWVQAEIEAQLSRWILECRRAQESNPGSETFEPQLPLPGAAIASAFLPLARSNVDLEQPRQISASHSNPPVKTTVPSDTPVPRTRRHAPASEAAQTALNFLETHTHSQSEAAGPPPHEIETKHSLRFPAAAHGQPSEFLDMESKSWNSESSLRAATECSQPAGNCEEPDPLVFRGRGKRATMRPTGPIRAPYRQRAGRRRNMAQFR